MMLKEALEYLVGLGKPTIEKDVNGQAFSDKPLHLLEQPTAQPLEVQSLSALVDYLKMDFDGVLAGNNRLLVHVADPVHVTVYGFLNSDARRSLFLRASANLPDFQFGVFYDDMETFIIKISSCFVHKQAETQPSIHSEVGRWLTHGRGEQGLAPDLELLRPYRTFFEVEQPASQFFFRMQDDKRCALFEADGGAWRMAALRNVQRYLSNQLGDLINAKKVVILA